MSHLTPADAAQWISGTLEPDEADRLEAHARVCPTCEALLQREARVEELLGRAARADAHAQPRAAPRRLAWVAVPLALAAAALLLLRAPPPASSAAPDAGAGDELVVDAAHFDGEAPPAEAFQARSPFAL